MARIVTLLLLLFVSTTMMAQSGLSPIWEHQLEQWAEQSESADIEELADMLALLHENPVNLNDSSTHQQLFFLSPNQIRALRYYLSEYGALLSHTELHLINGFDSLTITLLRPISIVEPIDKKEPVTLHNILHHAKHGLVIGSSRTLERSRGYLDSIYAGDPFRLYYLYTFNYRNQIRLQLSADKDPGELLSIDKSPRGFDFYGFQLAVKNIGRIRQLAVGQYRLQFGQGLTLWNGPQPWYSNYGGGLRNGQGITSASPFNEYDYLQGIAITLGLTKHTSASTFYSYRDIDATLSDSLTIQSIYQSGYHRTANEIAKRDVASEQIIGANLSYDKNRVHIGTTLQYDKLSKPLQPTPQPYNQFYFSGNENLNMGVDGRYHIHYTTIWGEIAYSQNGGWAGIIGTQTPLGNGNHIALSYRNYSRDYQNLHAAAWGQGSSSQNEEGLQLSLRYHLPLGVFLQLDIDHFRHPWLKYQIYSPTNGNEQRILLSRNLANKMQFTLSYRRKEYGRNGVDSISHTYSVEQVVRQTMKGRLTYQSGPFSGHTEVSVSQFSCEFHEDQSGLFLSQQLSYRSTRIPLRFETRFTLFDASSYDAALYSMEGDLRYEYASTMYNNQGLRFYLLASYAINEKISISAKYGITTYSNLDNIGSGYDAIASNHRQSVKLQLRCNL